MALSASVCQATLGHSLMQHYTNSQWGNSGVVAPDYKHEGLQWVWGDGWHFFIDRSYLNAKKYAILNVTRNQPLTIMKDESGADWSKVHAGRDDKTRNQVCPPKLLYISLLFMYITRLIHLLSLHERQCACMCACTWLCEVHHRKKWLLYSYRLLWQIATCTVYTSLCFMAMGCAYICSLTFRYSNLRNRRLEYLRSH